MQTEVLRADAPGAIERAANVLRAGGLVAFPTETVYGLGADATNALAVAGIFEAKRRPRIDPLIVHVADPSEADRYGRLEDGRAQLLAERFWPGPLTLVVPKRALVPPLVTAGLETVALRCPAHPVARALLRAAGAAVAAPSANRFGSVSPTEAGHVRADLDGRIELILDAGPASIGVESTIVSLVGEPALLRSGGIPLEQLEAVLGPVRLATEPSDRPQAPGQMRRHYATRTPFEIASGDVAVRPGERVGLLALGPPQSAERFAAVEALSPAGDLRQAAANLFAALRRLDAAGLDRIVALPVPEVGLGRAIMDRLRRGQM